VPSPEKPLGMVATRAWAVLIAKVKFAVEICPRSSAAQSNAATRDTAGKAARPGSRVCAFLVFNY
jgi:hypothetical protein